MIRTQIQMEPSMHEEVKRQAAEMQCSISELVRQSIEEKLAKQRQEAKWAASLTVLGRYGSGLGDLSEKHDDYLDNEW